MAIKEKESTVDLITDHLEKEERTLAWLSRKIDIPYGTMYSIFVHRIVSLSQDKLDKINDALGTAFTL